MNRIESIKNTILNLHFLIFDEVREQLVKKTKTELSKVVSCGNGDVTYMIDFHAEEIIDSFFKQNPLDGGMVVICEGMSTRTYPTSLSSEEARYRVLIDPLDGTREIMYDKRSCWILTGIAQNKGNLTTLDDLFLSIQTEVPPSFQDKSAVITATKGNGATLAYWDINKRIPITKNQSLCTSNAKDLKHGFSVFVNFFPGMKEYISRLEESVLTAHLGKPNRDSALTFSDEYISTAGQIFLLATGRYRIVADLRACIGKMLASIDQEVTLCCHPYDLSSYLILTESGGFITDDEGNSLNYPLNTSTNCSWIGYANKNLMSTLMPVINTSIRQLRYEIEKKAIEQRKEIRYITHMDKNSETAFTMQIADTYGAQFCFSEDKAYWQGSHLLSEQITMFIKEGQIIFAVLENDKADFCVYKKGDSVRIKTSSWCNIYMYPHSVTITIGNLPTSDMNCIHKLNLDRMCNEYIESGKHISDNLS